MTALLLELEVVSKWFAATQALYAATVRVQRGIVHALLGENGAGKDRSAPFHPIATLLDAR